MTTRAPNVCAEPGCPQLCPAGTGRCPEHARQPWPDTGRKNSLPPDWPHLRRAVLERDGHRCRCPGCPRCHTILGGTCIRQATDVHHTGNLHDHHPDQLLSLCGPCHHHESSSTGGRTTAGHVRPTLPEIGTE